MIAQLKRVFIGFSILWLAIACQRPSVAPAGVPTSDLALTLTSIVQTLTAQPASPVVSTNANIVTGTNTEIVITSTEAAPTLTEVVPTPTSALVMVIVDSQGIPVDTNPAQPSQSQPQPQTAAPTSPVPQPATAVSTVPPVVPTVQQFGLIRGIVLFKDLYATPVPVQGINVTVKAGRTTNTTQADGSTGEYFFSKVLAGPVIIEFKYANYMTQKLATVIVEPGREVTAPVFYVKPIVPHELPTPCSLLRPCTFPTLVQNAPAQ